MSDERKREYEPQGFPKYEHYQLQQPTESISMHDKKDVPVRKKVHRKNKPSFGKKLGTTIILATFFGIVAGVVFQGVSYTTGKLLNNADYVTLEKAEGIILQTNQTEISIPEKEAALTVGSVADVAQAVMPSVVAITSMSIQEIPSFFGFGYRIREYPSTGSGSGIIVGENEEELLIATNNHVIEGASTLNVCFIGSDVANAEEEILNLASGDGDINVEDAVSAKVKGTDPENDLAVISVRKEDIPDETKSQIKIAQIGVSDNLLVGEQVVAIGNALGYGQSVTSGWVSALNRTVTMDDGYRAELIQTDAAINPGNSGGALLNMRGELIGINSAKYADDAVEGMGYAIPISKAEPILEELMNRKTREIVEEEKAAYLGVQVIELSSEAIQMYNMPQGAFVVEATSGGAAEAAGLKKGDIIVKMDGQKISGGNDLIEKLQYYEAGEVVEIVIARAGNGEYREVSVQVEMASKPAYE